MSDNTIRDFVSKIENRELVLPEFQREFTWNKQKIRRLVDSLLKRYPVGSLLLWRTDDVPALKNMRDYAPEHRVDVLLDGQQRLTAMYMLVKGEIPPYYAERDIRNASEPRDLYYHLARRELQYHNEIEMDPNPLWVSVTSCFSEENQPDPQGIAEKVTDDTKERYDLFAEINEGFQQLRGILDVQVPVMYVQPDAGLSEALLVFDRTNSNAVPLRDSDIALAHMCSNWPETRRVFKQKLSELADENFEFDLRFLIRAMNAVINASAEYRSLHEIDEDDLKAGWGTLDDILDYLVNFLRGRAYIYGTDDINSPNALIPVIGFLAQNGHSFQSEEVYRKLRYWIYAALYKRRYSGSVDSTLRKDLNALDEDAPLEYMIADLKEEHGSPDVAASNLEGRGVGHPLYNMMNIVIRAREGVDWANGLALSENVGDSYTIQRHHIFPRSLLKDYGYETGSNHLDKKRVHEIANRVPLTRDGNLDIFDEPPSTYLPVVEENHSGNLEKFMVPMDKELWNGENYEEFLQARRELIAEGITEFMRELIEPAVEEETAQLDVQEIINAGESATVEFKSTLRWHKYREEYHREIEHSVLKTIAAFLNTDGGTLLIGVDDEGQLLGLEDDGFDSDDDLMLHLTNIVRDRIGSIFLRYTGMSVDDVDGEEVLVVRVEPSFKPAYVDYEGEKHFYMRTGPATNELEADEIHEYIGDRFYGNEV